jgi:HK97 family phage portal protein
MISRASSSLASLNPLSALMQSRRPAAQQTIQVNEDPPWAAEIRAVPDAPDTRGVFVDATQASMGARPIVTMDDYLSLYGENGPRWVHACVSAIARDVASMGTVGKDVRTGDEVAPPHPAFVRPFPDYSIEEHNERLIQHLVLTGNAFEYVDGSDELRLLPPGRVTIYPDINGQVREYGVRTQAGGETPIPAERVVHHRFPNPSNEFWGLGPLQALKKTLLIADGEDLWVLGYYQRGARASGFVKFPERFTVDQARAALAEIKQSIAGKHNSGRVAGLPGADWVSMASSPADGGYVEGRRLTQEEFLALLNVPPFRLNILEKANYANARQQLAGYYGDTVIPMGRRISSARNRNPILVPRPDSVVVAMDEDELMARTRDEQSIATAAGSAVRDGILTVGEARARFYGLGEKPAEQGEAPLFPYHLQFGVVTINEVRERLGLAPVPWGNEKTSLLPSGQEDGDRKALPAGRASPIHDARDRAMYEAAWDARQSRRERTLAQRIDATIRRIQTDILAIVDEHGGRDAPTQGVRREHQEVIPTGLEDALRRWDFSLYEGEILDEWIPAILEVMDEEGRIHMQMVGRGDADWDVENPRVTSFIGEHAADLVANVEDTTRTAIRDLVSQGYADGWSVDDLRKRLEATDDIGGRARAERIARTETAMAANRGAREAYEQAEDLGVRVRKRWLTVGAPVGDGPGETRASHRMAENEGALPLGQRFRNGLDHPADPDGDPSETVNCRCTLVPEVDDE